MKRNVVVALVIGVVVLCAISTPLSAQWTAPVPVNVCNTQSEEMGPFPSQDGLSLYFARLHTDTYFYARIFRAKRDQPFGPFTSVEQVFSSQFHVLHPWVSADNLRMYYTNELPTGWVIRMSTRASVDDPWPEGPVLTEFSALGVSLSRAALTSDERTIFFTSVYGAPGGQGGWDMWMATRPDRNSPFGAIRNLSELNSPRDDIVGSASLDGRTMYFHSDRNGTTQFFRATRHSADGPFDALEHLSFFDQPGGAGQGPTISGDGSALYFCSGTNAGPPDLWVSYPGSVVCGEDGAGCDDGSACTTDDLCLGDVCVGGPPPDCDDHDACTADDCAPTIGCTHSSTPGTDADGDGAPDTCDNCPTVANPSQADADHDGIGNACDTCTDTDGDAFGDPGYPASACPMDNCPGTPNASQLDTDDDAVGDVCDNCPLVANSNQLDSDYDGIGDACDPYTAQWTEPVPVEVCNTPFDDWGPFPSHEGLSLYFSRHHTDTYFYARIFRAKRDQPFGPFTSVDEVLSSSFHVEFPWVSADNLRMYYTNELPTGWVIRMSTRASVDDPWLEGPVLTELSVLGVSLNRAALTSDERTIFFTSVYGAPGGQGGWDMWMATRSDRSSPFGAIRNLSELNSPRDEVVGSTSPDGLTVYFQSDRNGTMQFFRATRHSGDGPFDALEHLSFFDRPDGAGQWPTISSDGTTLYFGRGTNGGPSDLWVSYLDSVVCGEDGAACDDGDACTRTDTCMAGACIGSNAVICDALDPCHDAGVCDPGTGACSNPVKPNGTVCDDNDLCTTGETCQAGTCTPAFSGLNEPNPRTNGYYKRLCHGPHSGDQLTDGDATCVAQVTSTFAGISTVVEICDVIRPSQPNGDACDRTEDDLMVLALNVCRARVCVAQGIDSQCGGNGSVGQSLAESDEILDSTSRDGDTCAHARCLTEEINTGRALELNSLRLRLEGSGVRLEWTPPYLDDGNNQPRKYHVWRRAQGSLAPFTKIGDSTEPTFLDTSSGSDAFEYEVTAVINTN